MPQLTTDECKAAIEAAEHYPPGFGFEYFAIPKDEAWLRITGNSLIFHPFGVPSVFRTWLKKHPQDMGKG